MRYTFPHTPGIESCVSLVLPLLWAAHRGRTVEAWGHNPTNFNPTGPSISPKTSRGMEAGEVASEATTSLAQRHNLQLGVCEQVGTMGRGPQTRRAQAGMHVITVGMATQKPHKCENRSQSGEVGKGGVKELMCPRKGGAGNESGARGR